jgi:hypothetical protein
MVSSSGLPRCGSGETAWSELVIPAAPGRRQRCRRDGCIRHAGRGTWQGPGLGASVAVPRGSGGSGSQADPGPVVIWPRFALVMVAAVAPGPNDAEVRAAPSSGSGGDRIHWPPADQAASRIGFHRRVVVVSGVPAVWVAAVCLLTVAAVVAPAAGLVLAAVVLVPYVAVLGMRRARMERLRLSAGWVGWLVAAAHEEEAELAEAVRPRPGTWRDAVAAAGALVVVVGRARSWKCRPPRWVGGTRSRIS